MPWAFRDARLPPVGICRCQYASGTMALDPHENHHACLLGAADWNQIRSGRSCLHLRFVIYVKKRLLVYFIMIDFRPNTSRLWWRPNGHQGQKRIEVLMQADHWVVRTVLQICIHSTIHESSHGQQSNKQSVDAQSSNFHVWPFGLIIDRPSWRPISKSSIHMHIIVGMM